MSAEGHNEELMPHSPDALERESSDNGFSFGWGLHHQAAESYIIDCHTHMLATNEKDLSRWLDEYFARAGAMRLRRLVGLDGNPENHKAFSKVSEKDDRFLWMIWPKYDKPDLPFLKKVCKEPGFIGLKLHNRDLIEEGAKPEIWLSSEWDEMLECCGEAGKPVLWHVTQRTTDCPYMGGGRNSYWKKGWENGVSYGNRELLDIFLEQVKRHPNTTFIGAHHLHVGPQYAGALFDAHPNLVVDLSCGNIVRFCDELYEADRQAWRTYFLEYQDRLLFGTDCVLGADAGIWYLWETLAAHIRFLHQLRLPKDVLEKVSRGNYERLAGLSPVELNANDWAAVRP